MSTQIVPANDNVKQLARFLDNEPLKVRLKAILPRELPYERLIYQTLTLANNNPKLAECTHQSVYAGIIQAADLHLELSGPLGQAYLVPRKNNGVLYATFQVGYRGLMTLAYRSGQVSNFHLRKVAAGDTLEVEYGAFPSLVHRPVLFPQPDADGKPVKEQVVAYYCVVNYRDGGKDFDVMTRQEVLAHRARFASTKSGGPWYDMEHGFHEMALKTVARRLCKRSPVSVQLATAAILDEYHEAGVITTEAGLPIDNTSRTGELADLLESRGLADPAKEHEPGFGDEH